MVVTAPIDKRPPDRLHSSEPHRGYAVVEEIALVSRANPERIDILADYNRGLSQDPPLPVQSFIDGFHAPSGETISTIRSSELRESALLDISNELTLGPVLRDSHDATFAVDLREALIGLHNPSVGSAAQFAEDYGLSVIGSQIQATSRLYRSSTGAHVLEEYADRLREDARVAFAEYNPLIGAGYSDEPIVAFDFSDEDEIDLWNHEAIHLHDVPRVTDYDDTLVIIIDTAVDASHSTLKDALLTDPLNAFNLIGDAEGYRHGTAVAAVIGSRLEIGEGHLLGLAPGVNLLCIAGLNRIGLSGAQARLDAVNTAAEITRQGFVELPNDGRRYAAKRVIVNCSWKLGESFAQGVPVANGTDIDLISFRVAFQELQDAGALVVCSAGNSNARIVPHFPSDYEGCISTAGIDERKKRYDAASGSNYGPNVDICAPGANLLIPELPSGFRFGNGTSYAAPHITATCALFWSANPHLTPTEVRDAVLTKGVSNIDAFNPAHIGELGSGLVDLPILMAALGS